MVSIIIPTLNAEPVIASLINSLNSQLIEKEIIVVDSSSSNRTDLLARQRGAGVIIIKRDSFDHGGTRNLAVKEAKGKILIFLTQDAIPANEHLIENLIRPFRDESIALCYGRQIAKNDSTPLERFARAFNYPDRPLIKSKELMKSLGIKTFFCSNVCSAIRRSAFDEVGGFPQKAIMNEDMVLAAKFIMQGYKIAYEPSAIVYHSHNYSLWQQFERYFDLGVSLNRQKWIPDLARAEGEGYTYLISQARYLWREKRFRWLGYVLGESIAKYAGYRLGLMEDYLPFRFKKMVSMHKYFWDQD